MITEWLNQIFASPSDKEFFITVITATLIVLVVLFLFNRVNRRRLQRAAMSGRVESLYAAAVEFEEKAFDAITLAFSGQDESDQRFIETVGAAHSALRRMRVTSGLYFEAIGLDHETLMNEVLHAISEIQEAVSTGDFDAAGKSMNDGFEQVSEDVKKLEATCLKLMKQYR